MNTSLLDIAEKSDMAFFAVRFPGEGLDFVSGASTKALEGCGEGFVIKGFEPDSTMLTIPVYIPLDAINAASEMGICHTPEFENEISTSRDEHLRCVLKSIEEIKRSARLEKVVISRKIVVARKFTLSGIFYSLMRRYPDSYVFCFRTRETGLWTGASPELLLRKEGGKAISMALAGTRRSGSTGEWSHKNRREQEIVTDYIAAEFRKYCPDISIRGPFTRNAGPVEHLCTEITGCLNTDVSIKFFLEQLAPTPALGGYPKDDALRCIRNNEHHPRGMYGGFAGIHTPAGKSEIFVTLRCMQLTNTKAILYSGGGITSESIPEEEWEETERKSRTLLDVIGELTGNNY